MISKLGFQRFRLRTNKTPHQNPHTVDMLTLYSIYLTYVSQIWELVYNDICHMDSLSSRFRASRSGEELLPLAKRALPKFRIVQTQLDHNSIVGRGRWIMICILYIHISFNATQAGIYLECIWLPYCQVIKPDVLVAFTRREGSSRGRKKTNQALAQIKYPLLFRPPR